MTPPRHADKDCLTTEESVTISSSRITRQGRCRCGAAESPLVARNHQPTQKAESSKNHWRHENSRMMNLRANVTDDENEWRTAQWRTRKAGRALADSWRQRKKRQECPSAQSTSENYLFLAQQISSSYRKISIHERKRDAAARLCSVCLRHHVFRGGITLDLVTTRVPEREDTVSDRETCHLRSTPKSWITARPGQGSHNTGGKECLLLGHRTGISVTILRDVSSDGVRPCQHVLLSHHRSHTTCRRNCSTTTCRRNCSTTSFHHKLNHGDGWLRMEI